MGAAAARTCAQTTTRRQLDEVAILLKYVNITDLNSRPD
jgi:hypothetical protein